MGSVPKGDAASQRGAGRQAGRGVLHSFLACFVFNLVHCFLRGLCRILNPNLMCCGRATQRTPNQPTLLLCRFRCQPERAVESCVSSWLIVFAHMKGSGFGGSGWGSSLCQCCHLYNSIFAVHYRHQAPVIVLFVMFCEWRFVTLVVVFVGEVRGRVVEAVFP